MEFTSVFYKLVVLLLVYGNASSELARLRLDGGRIITSSTLKWITGSGHIPEHAIPVKEDDVSNVWCRASAHGIFAGGSFSQGVCTAPFLGKVTKVTEGYEFLVSINGSARVKRLSWDKYNAAPHNAIASSEKRKNFLAMDIDKEGKAHGGFLVPKERRVHLVRDGKFTQTDEAFILAEDEPEQYDLRTISLTKRGLNKQEEDIVLKELTLSNKGDDLQSIVEEVETTVKHLVYWGQVKGTYVGRKATIVTPKPEKEEIEITWGIQNEFDRVYSKILEYELPAGTATDVKVVGVVRKTESPYIGTLTSIYNDGAQMSRVIEGLHIDERLVVLKAIYSTPYFIHNNTRLDLDPITHILYKSTTTTTTTTTTSTTTTPEPLQMSMDDPQEPMSKPLSSISSSDKEDSNLSSENSASLPQYISVVSLVTLLISTAMVVPHR